MPPVWTLTLDTATPYLALGLFRGEEGLGRVVHLGRRHEEALFDLLEALLAEVGARREEIGALVLGEGPGSYTGLRIALAAGLGIALAQGARVYGVGSLLAACWPFLEEGGPPLTPLFTARNGLYYGATYAKREGKPLEVNPPRKLRAEERPKTGLLLDPPPDPRALYELLPFAREGVEPLYL
ncbi:MAG: tRNA (adenosine(37)-N6)-threonylcarbamoyltransferase complex dimerization subunit type 1 TsaB [Thermus sp.]|uniref:tRNA (adenosine(37)-N6)-threonylcarbamoyltransferase complex dimerization subunit type 1 TsaB n=1 Tax=unclassified Thermus TaxID=2619321 RepID=UPI0012DDA6C4|nr:MULTISPECIES: tRNA (adenosine(37)-N6)-threonylcarbamoyltransferase complex dimerization subunit type 1 TsaB [unclassified Thermus]MCS6868715.1 tRNA (adenosine(37)-N6)-threonylcarbamoyltransferase complex dimerization subunit type 1 TsaB [Thermus sp.]MCS7218349.1 tRNA (adenosine(37)-N6)-threonylcarbamoyltransferase complex dimerization subunit type 1 TsaB [Thermus sp.]MDW8356471.1 tRNA (adenosine(37)-N6)-threonylcarbamoyltransferase complex dimerization subunit type 1 TsaB [Thermus sp.]